MRLMVEGLWSGINRATWDNGTSPPSGVEIKIFSKSATELRSFLGKRTITLTSSLPRCIRCTSEPKKARRTCLDISTRDKPNAWPCLVNSIRNSSLPSDKLSAISNTVG